MRFRCGKRRQREENGFISELKGYLRFALGIEKQFNRRVLRENPRQVSTLSNYVLFLFSRVSNSQSLRVCNLINGQARRMRPDKLKAI